MTAIVKYIGIVHSSLKDLEDCPRQESEQAPEAWIEIFPEYASAMKDLAVGDKVVLLSWLDKADRTVQETHPRNNPDTPLTGIFSTRSPDRPNPVGLHITRIVSITGNEFSVDALELLDQTPLIDIKPVL